VQYKANLLNPRPIIQPKQYTDYVTYIGKIFENANTKFKNILENIKREEAMKTAAERERFINNLYTDAIRNFEQIYLTEANVNKRIKVLEEDYATTLTYIRQNGLTIETKLYSNLTDVEFNKIKVYYLYIREKEEQIIETSFDEAMNYFENTYGARADNKIDELAAKYKYLLKIDTSYPEEVQEKYFIYRYYLYDKFHRTELSWNHYLTKYVYAYPNWIGNWLNTYIFKKEERVKSPKVLKSYKQLYIEPEPEPVKPGYIEQTKLLVQNFWNRMFGS